MESTFVVRSDRGLDGDTLMLPDHLEEFTCVLAVTIDVAEEFIPLFFLGGS